MTYTFENDQSVPGFTYKVLTGGTYNDDDQVVCYLTSDPTKAPWSSFSAYYIANGNEKPAPSSDYASFETAIWQDTTIPDPIKLQLALLFPLISSNINNSTVLKTGWQLLIAVNGVSSANPAGWLTTDLRSKIEGYAQQFNVGIV